MKALTDLNAKYLACLEAGDYKYAFEYASQALKMMPDHPQILGDLAMCYMRLKEYDNAFVMYRRAIKKLPDEANLYDGLTELFGILSNKEQAKETGRKALNLKAKQNYHPSQWQIPNRQPIKISANKSRNVIAFSLFGDNPRYCETALLNVVKAESLFPNWTCRFYINNTVPKNVQVRLLNLGAELVFTEDSQWSDIPPLMWRFAVMDDPNVDRFLLRDADSILSNREQRAVLEWLDSERWFHHMRDYYTHTELILAGLFGGSAGVFLNLNNQMKIYAKSHQGERRVVDQHFLRRYVWPVVRDNLMSHDSWFGFNKATEFPAHQNEFELSEDFHVGCNYSTSSIGEDGVNKSISTIKWELIDENNQRICYYENEVISGSWRAALPKIYIEKIKSGFWKIRKL